MPLDKLMLIIVVVGAAIGVTFWAVMLIATAAQVPLGWLALLPAALAGYIAWRVISERLANAEDDHYDRIEK